MEQNFSIQKPFRKVYVEITNICNLSCSFCAGTTRKKEFMSKELFISVLDKIKEYTDYVYFHVMGEPLLHPLVSDFFDEAEKRELKVVLVTNGTKLSELSDMLLSKKALHKINISLHALEANSTIDRESYLDSCFDFCDKASQRGVVSVFRLWNSGVQSPLNNEILCRLHEFFPDTWQENSRGFRIKPKLFLEYANRFSWHEDSEKNSGVRCYALKDQFAILCDGSVIPCCIDCEGKLKMGNIKTEQLSDMLSGSPAKALRSGFDRGEAIFDTCKKCGFIRKRL